MKQANTTDETMIIDAEYQELPNQIEIEGLSEAEVKKLYPLLQNFIKSYQAKAENVSDEEWLTKQLAKELPEKSLAEIQETSKQSVDFINEFEENLKSVNKACSEGQRKEVWFANKVAESSVGVAINEYGNYLEQINTTLENSNKQMMRTVLTKAGRISQCFNLDGFIAEQHAVNTFNQEAILKNSNYFAEVKVPEAGEVYGKNSFDLVIKDKVSGKIVQQYQAKYGVDAKATIELLKRGNYNNQRLLVPTEQVEAVQKAFPNKTVQGYIGDDTLGIQSKELTKEQAKDLQKAVQEKSKIQQQEWSHYNTKELALHLGKNSALAGMGSAVLAAGIITATKAIQGEKIEADEMIELALRTGSDTGIKTATAGAIHVGIEKGFITVLPKGTPIGMISAVACVGIENAKIAIKIAGGELSVVEGFDHMGRTTTALCYGLGWGATGAVMGATAFSFIPVIGTFVGAIVGGMIGYMAGSEVGKSVYEGTKKIVKGAANIVKSAYNGVKSGAKAVVSFVKSIFS